jgi:hypothetical protein
MAKSVRQELEWLVIFLVYNNNYYDGKESDTVRRNKDKDYRTMEAQTKYILKQVRYSGYNTKVQTIFVEAEIKNSDVNNRRKVKATLSMLKKIDDTWLPAEDRVWRRETRADILTDSRSLRRILTKLKKSYPAKKHMIITAGHGSILGINYYVPGILIPELDEKTVEFLNQRDEQPIPKTEMELTLSQEQVDNLLILTNQEINEVLTTVFPNKKKLDVLVMYNCVMQNIFTQFELRNKVDWLITAQSGIGIPGFNYVKVLNKINKNPAVSPDEVAKSYIDSIRKGNGYSFFKKDIEQSWNLVATKLDAANLENIQRQFDKVFEKMNKLSEEGASIISHVNEVIKHLFSYSIYCLPPVQIFDLGSFLASLAEKINDKVNFKDLSDAIAEFQKTLKQSPLPKIPFIGDSFYNNNREIIHYETTGSNHEKIANIGLLFPINNTNSEMLNEIYVEEKYRSMDPKDRYLIPNFLKSESYAKVVNKIHQLPPMDA